MNTCTPSARTTSAPSASKANLRRRARRQAPAFVARPTATAVAAMLLIHGAAFALPQDGKPTFGNTTTQQSGNSLTIQQTSGKAGINWGSFSIQAGEKVTIVQPSSGSVLVNRVVGPDPSSILGNLSANGQVFLINPQGVVFGSGSQVNVGGLVATSLSMSDADAQAGRLRLQPNADGRAGPVSNAGTITARNGTVALVAPQVANTGTIDARRVGMAAASEVVVDLEGDGLILFNTGAADDAKLEQLGRIRAEGGPVQLQASARNALAGTVLNLQGAVVARGITELVGGGQSGGTVVVDGGSNGITQVGGSIDAAGVGAGQKGGDVTVLGSKVLLGAQASINASGDAGGGRIRVGGDYQGSNPGLKNADMVTVLAGARLDASATGQGDGGTVIVWSDDATRFHGDIAARGGERGGNGGLVEVSGKGFLDYQGAVDTRAPLGAAGTLLLDPTNLTISTGPADINGDGSTSDDLINPTLAFGAPGVNSVITAAAVENQLATSNVTLQATNDITVSTSINASIPRELTLQAGNNINVFADLNGMSIVTLSANDPGSSARVATGRVSVTGSISTATSGTINITNNAGTGVNLVQGAVSGGGIVLNGTSTLSGTVALQGIAVDAGVTTINGATLQNRPDVSIAAGAGVVFTDNQTIGGLNGDGTVVLPVTGTLTLNPVADATYAGVISGTGNVFKDGTGKQTFSGDNTYSGTTDNRGYGTLQVGDGGNTGTIGTGAFFSDSTFVVNRSNDYLISNAIPGNGFGVLTQAGVGRTVVTSSNAFDQVNVEAGTLEVRGPTASIGNSGATVNVASAATLDVTDGAFINGTVQLNGGTIANSTGNGAVAGDVNLTANSTFQSGGPVFAAGANLTFTGTVSDGFVDSSQSGTPHGITKTGTGTVRLAAVNDFYGPLLVNGGTMVISNPLYSSATPNAVSIAAGATLQLTGGGQMGSLTGDAGSQLVLGADQSLSFGSFNTDTLFAGVISGGGPQSTVTKVGTGVTVFTGTNTYDGVTQVLGYGTLALGDGGTTGSIAGGAIQIDQGILSINHSDELVLNNAIHGLGRLVQEGTGRTVLTANNDYANTSILAGSLEVRGASASAGIETILVGPGTTLDLTNGAVNQADVELNGGTLANSAGTGTQAALVRLTVDSTLNSDGAGLTLQVGLRDPQSDEAGTGSAGLTKTGTGIVSVSGNAFTGALQVDGGTLELRAPLYSASIAPPAAVTIASTATLSLLGGGELGSLTGDVGSQLLLSSSAPTSIGSDNTSTLFAGVVAGIGDLTKVGTGTLTLTGANTGTGATQVSAGTLRVEGSLQSGIVRVNGGTLDLPVANALSRSTTLSMGLGSILLGGDETVNSAGLLGGVVSGPGRLIASTYVLSNTTVGNLGDGSGTMTVSGNSTVTGSVDVTSINMGASLLFNSNTAALLSADVSGQGTLRKSGSGELTLVGNNSYTGGTQVTGGTLRGDTDSLIGNIALSAGTAATIDQASNATFGAQVSGAGSLVKAGTGEVTLTTAQTQTGGTDVQAGRLILAAGSSISGGALTVAAPGAVTLGANQTVTTLDSAGNLDGTGFTLTANNYTLRGGTVGANLGAGATLNQAGGTTLLQGTAAATQVDVTGGTLTLAAPGRLTGMQKLNANGGAIELGGGAYTLANGVTLANNGRISGGDLTSAVNYDFQSGTVDAALHGSAALVKSGPGSVTVLGANNYGGGTQVQAGTLVGNTQSLQGGIVNNASLVFDQPVDGTYAGAISGTGELVKQGAGVLAFAGSNTYTGATRLLAGGFATIGDERLADDSALQIANGASFTLGGTETVKSLEISGTITGGKLIAGDYNLNGGTVNTELGAGNISSVGQSTLNGVSAARTVTVNDGTLNFGSAGRLTDNTATVAVSHNAALNLGGNETVAKLDLSGTLGGSGTLQAATYALDGGTAATNLGTGALTSTGASQLKANVAAQSIAVTGGSLDVASTAVLSSRPDLVVAEPGALTLGGSQVVATIQNSGSLTTGTSLTAQTIASPGAVNLGGSVTTTGSQNYGGSVKVAAAGVAPTLSSGEDVTALNTGNDFGTGSLNVQAKSAKIYGGGASDLSLGNIALGATSEITSQQALVVRGNVSLEAGTLKLTSQAAATNGERPQSAAGTPFFLPEFQGNGGASINSLVYAAPVITQAEGSSLTLGANTALVLSAPGGGSIVLDNPANQIGGTVSAVSGRLNSAFVPPSGSGDVRVGRVSISMPTLAIAGDGIEADVVSLKATSIKTLGDSTIRARLPYSVNQGTTTSLAGLTLDLTGAPSGSPTFGSLADPIRIVVNDSVLGVGGLFLTVLPAPTPGVLGTSDLAVFLACAPCLSAPVYAYGGEPSAVAVTYNGGLLSVRPQNASAISNNTSLLETARRGLFEEAVRTENVAPRLRAGVIAEVGSGRPATEGAAAATRPEVCEPKAGDTVCN